eukprot:TRINITY_DN1412_c0_g1_i5.p1 TRINITY_DN1412_c0_g1~~TRINITY_DN1412_c0_g1_i5.p1  ORF type:complete len:628 (+),score=103.33 TRINITY_DN1412_c0_g1_i5:1046-2929(+)
MNLKPFSKGRRRERAIMKDETIPREVKGIIQSYKRQKYLLIKELKKLDEWIRLRDRTRVFDSSKSQGKFRPLTVYMDVPMLRDAFMNNTSSFRKLLPNVFLNLNDPSHLPEGLKGKTIHCLKDMIREFNVYLQRLQPETAVQNQDDGDNKKDIIEKKEEEKEEEEQEEQEEEEVEEEEEYSQDFLTPEELEEIELKEMYWILYPADISIKDLIKEIETDFEGYSEEEIGKFLERKLHGFTKKEIKTVKEVLLKQLQKRKQMMKFGDTKELTAMMDTNVNPESKNVLDIFLQKIEEEEKMVKEDDKRAEEEEKNAEEEEEKKVEEQNMKNEAETIPENKEEEKFNKSVFHAFMKNAEKILDIMTETQESSDSEPKILFGDLWKVLVVEGQRDKDLQDGLLDYEQWRKLWTRMKKRVGKSRTISYRELFEVMTGKEFISKEKYEKLLKEKENLKDEIKRLTKVPPKMIEKDTQIPPQNVEITVPDFPQPYGKKSALVPIRMYDKNITKAFRGLAGKFYCKKELTDCCLRKCTKTCGPEACCTCLDCMRLDKNMNSLNPWYILNRLGYPTKLYKYEDGRCFFYCGRQIRDKSDNSTGFCEPGSLQCQACSDLEKKEVIQLAQTQGKLPKN